MVHACSDALTILLESYHYNIKPIDKLVYQIIIIVTLSFVQDQTADSFAFPTLFNWLYIF